MRSQFLADILGGELPIDAHLHGVPCLNPSCYLPPKRLDSINMSFNAEISIFVTFGQLTCLEMGAHEIAGCAFTLGSKNCS